MTDATYNRGTGELIVNFSETVDWDATDPGDFIAIGSSGGVANSEPTGAQASRLTYTFDMDAIGTFGTSGTLTYNPSGTGIVSDATGLPMLAFTHFPLTVI